MSDIRAALQGRLKSIDDELMRLSKRREHLSKLRETVSTALAQEEALMGAIPDQPELVLHPTGGRGSLANDVINALSKGSRTLDDLKRISASWFPEGYEKQPGRAINFVLVGLQRGGYVERLESGAWQLTNKGRKE